MACIDDDRAGHTAPRGSDRRQAPRRAEETTLHYAETTLLAAALAVAEHRCQKRTPGSTVEGGRLLRNLDAAAASYREAEAAAQAARS